MTCWRRCVLLLGVSLVLAACGGGDGDGDDVLDAGTTTTSGEASIRGPEDLEPLLLADVPPGFQQQPDDVGDTGPSDLDKAVADDPSDDARAFFVEHGFVAGYQRMWTSGPDPASDNALLLFLYAFEAPDGASAHFTRSIEGMEADEASAAATRFEVPGVPGAVGYALSEDGRHGAVVLFTKGGFIAQLVLGGPQPVDTNVVADLARQQYDRL